MVSRFRYAAALALLVGTLTLTSAFAKGGFDFISITGPGLKEELRITDAALTEDFFTFANFYKDRTQAPADSGEGYEIRRYYIEGSGAIVFDRLHYYPESGFVFYDGIENGESEYDGEWYTANPALEPVFESALAASAAQHQPENTTPSSGTVDAAFPPLPVTITLVATGLTILLVLLFGRRKPSGQ